MQMNDHEKVVQTLRSQGRGTEAAKYAREHGARDPDSGLHGRFDPLELVASERARDRCLAEGQPTLFARYYEEELAKVR